MTTIACDGTTMAADGLSHYSGTILSTDARKVYRLADGSVIGACGSYGDTKRVIEWIEGGERPDVARDFGAIWMRRDGVQWCADDLQWFECILPVAMGSGMDLAIGAMLTGATTARAVGIASQRDIHTGGTIRVEALASDTDGDR